MAWYRQGTISITTNTKAVTGASTGWVNQAKSEDRISFDGGDKWYEIDVVGGNTSITLKTNYTGATLPAGTAYAIDRSGRYWNEISAAAAAIADYLAQIPLLGGITDALKVLRANSGGTAWELTSPAFGTVAVGTVTTGAPGSSATVTNSGTSANAILDFTIPRGTAGGLFSGSEGSVAELVDTDNLYISRGGTPYKITREQLASALYIPRGASNMLGGEEGIAIDFITRTVFVNDHTDTKSESGRPSDFITFTRTTTATYMGKNGLLKTAAVNEARYGYDPDSSAPLGYIYESSRTNILLQSNVFSNASWTKTDCTIVANAGTSIDGTNGATKIMETSNTAGQPRIVQLRSFTTGLVYNMSGWFKAGTRNYVALYMVGSGIFSATTIAYFDILNGTITSTGAGTTAKIEKYPNGWYRCSITATCIGTGNANVRYNLSADGTTLAYNGDGSSYILAERLQVEQGPHASSYIDTTTAQVTRGADAATFPLSIVPFDPACFFMEIAGTMFGFSSANVIPVSIDDGSSFSNGVYLTFSNAGVPSIAVYAATVYQGFNSLGTYSNSGIGKFAVAGKIKLNEKIIVASSGPTNSTDTSNDMPTGLVTVRFGQSGTSTNRMDGAISRLVIGSRNVNAAELRKRCINS